MGSIAATFLATHLLLSAVVVVALLRTPPRPDPDPKVKAEWERIIGGR